MAESYTVTVNNSTPVEITGGRVGTLLISQDGAPYIQIGGADMTLTEVDESLVVENGFTLYGGSGERFRLTITSPDEIYAVSHNPSTPTTVLTIFHNR